ncbi:MAG: dienelactone hydrolase family protein [Pseudomonadota bacterium]|nr:dienelactone hydrolase family protein [Pseudomonadota bacterium]
MSRPYNRSEVRQFLMRQAMRNEGFAAAVQPIQAQSVVHTDSQGLEAGEVAIPVRDGTIAAFRAMPAGGKNLPTVVLVHEIWSVHEYFKDLCRRLAKLGYLAVAPDLFGRQGDVDRSEIEAVRAVVAKVPDAQVMSDLDAAVQWASQNGGNPDKLGVTGFCWGGRITWLYAAHNPRVKAGVAWYGPVAKPATPLQPKHPVDIAAQLEVPVLGLYGGADAGIPNDTVEKMQAALKTAGKPSRIHLYPDTPHAFHADYRPSYRKEAADDGWKRMLEWFLQHGVA